MVTKVSLFDGHSTNSENGTVGLEGAERGGGEEGWTSLCWSVRG